MIRLRLRPPPFPCMMSTSIHIRDQRLLIKQLRLRLLSIKGDWSLHSPEITEQQVDSLMVFQREGRRSSEKTIEVASTVFPGATTLSSSNCNNWSKRQS